LPHSRSLLPDTQHAARPLPGQPRRAPRPARGRYALGSVVHESFRSQAAERAATTLLQAESERWAEIFATTERAAEEKIKVCEENPLSVRVSQSELTPAQEVKEEAEAAVLNACAAEAEARHALSGAEARVEVRLSARITAAEAAAAEAIGRVAAAEAAAAAAMAKCNAAATTLSAVRDATAAALRRMGAAE